MHAGAAPGGPLSKAAQLAAAQAVLLVALDSLERDRRPEALAVRTALDLLDPTPSPEAVRSKDYRDRKRARARDADTPASRSVTVASRDALRDASVTRHGEITPTPVVGPLSALSLPDSPSLSASSAAEGSEEREEQSASASRRVTQNVTPHVRPVVPRATRPMPLESELPERDPEDSEVDATAAVLSAVGLLGVSPKDVDRVRKAMPLLRTLAAARGCGPGDVLRAAKERFDAAEAAGGKVLGYPVLFSQLEKWAALPPAPEQPRRLIPLAPAPEPPPDPDVVAARAAEGMAAVRAALGGKATT